MGTRARGRAPCSATRGDSTAPPHSGVAASKQTCRPLHCALPPSAMMQLHQTLLEAKHFHFSPCKKEGVGACSTAPDTGRHLPVAPAPNSYGAASAPGAPAGSRAKVKASPTNRSGVEGQGDGQRGTDLIITAHPILLWSHTRSARRAAHMPWGTPLCPTGKDQSPH